MDLICYLVLLSVWMVGCEWFYVGYCIYLFLCCDELCVYLVLYVGEERGFGGVRNFEEGEGNGGEVGKDCLVRYVYFGFWVLDENDICLFLC